MDIDAWEASVVRAIEGIELERLVTGGDPDWTCEVLTALCTAGRECGFHTRAETGADQGEWLWDCIWLDRDADRKGNPIRCVPMVAECEWQAGAAIFDDFDKLLVATAPLRVFVFSAGQGVRSTALDRARDRALDLLDRVKAIEIVAPCKVRYLLLAREWSDRPKFWHFKIELNRPNDPRSWRVFEV